MASGTRTPDLPLNSAVDEILGNVNTGAGMTGPVRVKLFNLATRMAISGGVAFSSWIALNATTGTTVGERAEVYGDPGTHFDSITGLTVPNSGVYGWSASPAGWGWISADASLRGTTIHATSGPPAATLGIDGDWAIDGATYAIYGPKANGLWPPTTTTAQSAAAAAAGSAAAAALSATQAQSALSAMLAQSAGQPSARAMVATEGVGLAIHAASSHRENIAVIDTATPPNSGAFDLSDWLASTAFPYAKMVSTREGGLSWGAHNLLAIPSEDLTGVSYTKNQMSVAAGAVGPSNASIGNLLTASGTAAKVTFTASNQTKNGWHSLEFVAAPPAGAAAYVWVGVDGVRTWFDLVSGAVGTVGATISAAIFTTDSYGDPLSNGYKRLVVRYKAIDVTAACEIGFSTADNSTTSANAQAALVTQIHSRRGVLDGVGYVKTVGAANYGAPMTWIDGRKGILIEPAIMTYYGLWSNDLTQAAWTATNVTAALTQTGPDGTPCSLLTATSNGGTILQSKTSTFTNWSFAPYIKRVSGTGTISVTLDNGVTWTDVTSQVGSGWTRMTGIYSGNTNPTFGFKLGTSGDQFAVSLANIGFNGSLAHVSSPLPTFGTDTVQRLADVFSLPVSKYYYNSTGQLYADLRYSSDVNARSQGGNIGPDGPIDFIRYAFQNGIVTRSAKIGGAVPLPNINPLANVTNAQNEVELSVRFGTNTTAMTVNGEPVIFNRALGAPSGITEISVGGYPVVLFSLVYTTNVKSDDDLRTWRWSGRNGPTNLLDDMTMQRSGADIYLGENREPTGIAVIQDTPTSAVLFAAWCPNNKVTNISGVGEWPQRTFYMRYAFNKITKKLSRIDASPVLFEEPGVNGAPNNFAGGYGSAFIPIAITVKGPVHNGRMIVFYNLDDGNGLSAGFKLNLYKKYTDDPLAASVTWSARSKIYDVVTDYSMPMPGRVCPCSVVQMPASSAHPYRIVIAMMDDDFFNLYLAYSDDGGDTWTKGATFSWINAGVLNPQGEFAMSYLPGDDSIAVITRQRDATGTYANKRCWAKISGGGTTVTFQGALPGYTYTVAFGCWGSAVQADPNGATGTWGRTYFVSPENDVVSPGTGSAVRTQYRIRAATDGAMTFGAPLSFLSPCRYAGYSGLAYLSGGYLVNTYETGPVGFNYENTSHIAVLQVAGP